MRPTLNMIKAILLLATVMSSVVAVSQDRKEPRGSSGRPAFSFVEGDSCLPLIRRLETTYEIRNLMVGAIGTIDVDAFVPGANPPYRESWRATLKKKGETRRVQMDVFFPYSNGHVSDTAGALANLSKYYDLTLSVPWLQRLLSNDTAIVIIVKYVGGISLSTRAQAAFLTSLAKHSWRGEQLIEELLPQLREVAFIDLDEEYGKYSRWLVLPNREMILWHYKGLGVLDLDPFQETECSGHRAIFVRVSPQGKVIGTP